MFKNLKGIQKERDVQARPESTLEKLLKIEEQVHQEYAGEVSGEWKKNHDDIYLPMYQSLSSTLPQYTEQDLQSLLLTKANNNYNHDEARVLGMYTGVLLHVLTERYEKEGKKARFTFDLHKNKFDYLFLFAKRAGELTVKNVKGERTCAYIAVHGGTAEKIVIEGNEGNDAAIGVGSYNGYVGMLIINGNEGDYAAFCAGSYKGNVGTMIIKGNVGNYSASDAGISGGNVETMIIYGNKGNSAASEVGDYDRKVGTIALYNAGRYAGFEAKAKRIIKGREALKLYKKLEKRLPCLTD